MKVWLDGALVDQDAARVSVLDHGLTVGDGVFETLAVLQGSVFAPTRHVARLQRSAELLGLEPPPADLVAGAVSAVVAANAAELGPLARCRITLTSGPGPAGSERGGGPGTLVVTTSSASPWPATTAVVTVPWPRNERGALAGVKSTSYAENAIALARAREQGASEAVVSNTRGELCEGTGSNVFVVIDGEVLTPALGSGCLAGITRALVLEWFDVTETVLPAEALHSAEEVFLTSSTRNVHPVSRIDGVEREPGPVATAMAAAFLDRMPADLDP